MQTRKRFLIANPAPTLKTIPFGNDNVMSRVLMFAALAALGTILLASASRPDWLAFTASATGGIIIALTLIEACAHYASRVLSWLARNTAAAPPEPESLEQQVGYVLVNPGTLTQANPPAPTLPSYLNPVDVRDFLMLGSAKGFSRAQLVGERIQTGKLTRPLWENIRREMLRLQVLELDDSGAARLRAPIDQTLAALTPAPGGQAPGLGTSQENQAGTHAEGEGIR